MALVACRHGLAHRRIGHLSTGYNGVLDICGHRPFRRRDVPFDDVFKRFSAFLAVTVIPFGVEFLMTRLTPLYFEGASAAAQPRAHLVSDVAGKIHWFASEALPNALALADVEGTHSLAVCGGHLHRLRIDAAFFGSGGGTCQQGPDRRGAPAFELSAESGSYRKLGFPSLAGRIDIPRDLICRVGTVWLRPDLERTSCGTRNHRGRRNHCILRIRRCKNVSLASPYHRPSSTACCEVNSLLVSRRKGHESM